jgi:hypothetical protein
MLANLARAERVGPGLRQQPEAAPEAALAQEPLQPTEAQPKQADGPGASAGSGRGRRAQAAHGAAQGRGIFGAGADGQDPEGRYRQDQPVARDAGGIGAASMLPLPAAALMNLYHLIG